MEEMPRVRPGDRALEFPRPLWERHCPGAFMCSPPGSSLNTILNGFIESCIHRHDRLSHWPLVTEPSLQLCPIPGGGSGWGGEGRTWSSNPLITEPTTESVVGSPGNQPPSLGGSKSYLIDITKDTFIALVT